MLKNFLKFIKLNTKKIGAILSILVIGLLLLSNQNGDTTIINEVNPKLVQIYEPQNSYIETIGTVLNSQVIEIKSQTSGVVNQVYIKPGMKINYGNQLISIGSSYNFQSPAVIQAKISRNQYEYLEETYNTQVENIETQKQIAIYTEENAYEQRRIAESSLNDTNKLVEESEKKLEELKNLNIDGSLDAEIAGLNASLAQLKATQRSLSYSSNNEEPQAKISISSKELTLKQLELQKLSLDLQLEISRLSLLASESAAAVFNPVSPASGIIESVSVSVNSIVSPGQTIAVINSNGKNTNIIAFIPRNLYPFIDSDSESILKVNDNEYIYKPSYISSVPTKGLLHQIQFEIEEDIKIADQFINIKLPVKSLNTKSFLIPLEALTQTQNENIVYVNSDGIAKSKIVEIGSIQANYVEILSGLSANDSIIVSRNIADGDPIRLSN